MERSPSLWKSVKYERQRLYQQNGASAQHARPYHEQGQDAIPKLLVAGDVIRVWHLCAPAFSCDEVLIDRVAGSPSG
jgi:hypothetical protein